MSPKDPAPAVPAATIMMLRDRSHGLEVFMIVRHHEADFASGALVFPGGKADPADFDARLEPYLDGAEADAQQRGIQVAAIREAFEECGILLAREPGVDNLVSRDRVAGLEPYRMSLHRGEVSLRDFLAAENLHLACDQLTHFAHWITPENAPRRFDTHFFLAAAPEDHLAVHDGHESVDSIWIPPLDALADGDSGKRTMIFPTSRNLAKLGRSRSVGDAVQAARDSTVICVLPWLEKRSDGSYLCIPPEAGYDVSERKVSSRTA